MTKRWRIRLILLLLAIAGGALYLVNREPSYDGETLSSWLKDLSPDDANSRQFLALEAIERIGTNALPYLLKELRRKDSPAKQKLMEWDVRLESRFEHRLTKLKPDYYQREAAVEAFRVLGSNAVSAIPEICRNLDDQDLAGQSASALACIGRAALPAIKEYATSTNVNTRLACAYALLEFTNANDFVPTCQKLTADIQPEIRSIAAYGLGRNASAPEVSVPILIRLLNDANYNVQIAACRSLASFGTNAIPAAPALSNIFFSNGNSYLALRVTSGRTLRQTDPSSVQIFLKGLNHPDAAIRSQAVGLLGRVRDDVTNHMPEILSLLRDPDTRVRANVPRTLGELETDPTQFMPRLLEALALENDETVLHSCFDLLLQHSSAATNALPLLIKRLEKTPADSNYSLLWMIAAIDEDAGIKLGASSQILHDVRAQKASAVNGKFRLSVPDTPPIPVPPPSP